MRHLAFQILADAAPLKVAVPLGFSLPLGWKAALRKPECTGEGLDMSVETAGTSARATLHRPRLVI